MNELEFGNVLINELEDRFPSYTLSIETITKINDQKLYGMKFALSNDLAAPIIYLKDVRRKLDQGLTISEIADEIEMIISLSRLPIDIPPEIIPAVDSLAIRLLDPDINQSFLKNIPSITLDSGLAIICDAVMDDGFGGQYRVIIDNNLLRKMDCSKQSLFDKALRNMQKEQPVLLDLCDAAEASDDNLFNNSQLDPNSFYLLTNHSRIFGAAQIVRKEVRARIASILGGDFYIIPSSLHELLLISTSAGFSKNELEAMLYDANRTVLRPDDVLTDKVLYVDHLDFELKAA